MDNKQKFLNAIKPCDYFDLDNLQEFYDAFADYCIPYFGRKADGFVDVKKCFLHDEPCVSIGFNYIPHQRFTPRRLELFVNMLSCEIDFKHDRILTEFWSRFLTNYYGAYNLQIARRNYSAVKQEIDAEKSL